MVADPSDAHAVHRDVVPVKPYVEEVVQRVASHQDLQLLFVVLHRLLLRVVLRLIHAQIQGDFRSDAVHRIVERRQLALHFVQLEFVTFGGGERNPEGLNTLQKGVFLMLQLGGSKTRHLLLRPIWR